MTYFNTYFNVNDRDTWDYTFNDFQALLPSLPDGNYPHPVLPWKYMSVVAGHNSYERDCPNPKMKYDPVENACRPAAEVPEERVYAYLVERGMVNDQRS